MALFVVVLAIRSYTDEVRHGSMVPTFLATPDRLRVLAAKSAVGAGAAVVFAVGALVVAIGVIAVYLATHGFAVPVTVGALVGPIGRAIVIAVLWSVIGVAVGVMVRQQVAAIVGHARVALRGGEHRRDDRTAHRRLATGVGGGDGGGIESATR